MLYGLRTYEVKKNKVVSCASLGYFTNKKLHELENIVLNNTTDICETIYNYAVIYKLPTNQLYAGCYATIFKAYKVITLKKPYKYDDVRYEEIEKTKLPLDIRRRYTDLAIDEIIQEEEQND